MTRYKVLIKRHSFFVLLTILSAAFLGLGIRSSGSDKQNEKQPGKQSQIQNAIPNQNKRVTRKRVYENEPVLLTAIKLNGTAINLDAGIEGNEDWLSGLTVSVKNTSQKPIIFVEFTLSLAQSRSSNNIMSHSFRYGCDPKSSPIGCSLQLINPGDVVEFGLSNGEYDALKHAARERRDITEVRNADLELFTVKFDDDTAWASGVWMHRDPNNPSRWNRVEQ